ncbi:MAG TPA: hypothetical protein VKB56_01660 [Terriglobales bacterium]|nr:hypothetical protein [Terriglobales bacterium]
MKRRIVLWGLVGFFVASIWVIASLTIHVYPLHPVLWALARITCPILPVSLALHFGVKWYWLIASNFAAYALLGLIVESLRQLSQRGARGRTTATV